MQKGGYLYGCALQYGTYSVSDYKHVLFILWWRVGELCSFILSNKIKLLLTNTLLVL